MKKFLALLAALVLLMTTTVAFAATTCQLHLKIKFDKNIVMARYDADVYLNDVKVATIQHGQRLDAVFTVSTGNCVITFRSTKDSEVYGSTTIGLTKDATYSCEIHANLADIEIRKVDTDAGDPIVPRIPYGTYANFDTVQIRVKDYRTVSSLKGVTPAPGYSILVCEVEFTNLSDTDVAVCPPLYFEGCVDDYETDLLYAAMIAQNDALTLFESFTEATEIVRPGKRVVSNLIFQVPSNWRLMELYFKGDFVTDTMVFIVPRTGGK